MEHKKSEQIKCVSFWKLILPIQFTRKALELIYPACRMRQGGGGRERETLAREK